MYPTSSLISPQMSTLIHLTNLESEGLDYLECTYMATLDLFQGKLNDGIQSQSLAGSGKVYFTEIRMYL